MDNTINIRTVFIQREEPVHSAYNVPHVGTPAGVQIEVDATEESIPRFIQALDLYAAVPTFTQDSTAPVSVEPGVYSNNWGSISYKSLLQKQVESESEEQELKTRVHMAAVHVNRGWALPTYEEITGALADRDVGRAVYKKYAHGIV